MPVLLISRGTMSGVRKLVDRLEECTGWRSVSREDLVELVNRHGALAQRIVERLSKATQAYEQFCELRRPYVILMRTALLEYAREGDLIYHGYSGHLLVPPVGHFRRVRINAPLALRVEMTRARLDCSEEEAREHIAGDDEARVRWARFMYGKDIRDPGLYDLCIDLERTSIETACRVICSLAADPGCQSTPESTAQVENLLLASHVEAALVVDPRTAEIEAGARVEAGEVTVTGPYLDDARVEQVLAIARGVEGVGEVVYEPGYAPVLTDP